jgi:hypothetical protein
MTALHPVVDENGSLLHRVWDPSWQNGGAAQSAPINKRQMLPTFPVSANRPYRAAAGVEAIPINACAP